MSVKYTCVLLITFLCLAACTHFNYVGKSFERTNDVAIYFSEKEIEKDYMVMGHAVSAGQIFISEDDFRSRASKFCPTKPVAPVKKRWNFI